MASSNNFFQPLRHCLISASSITAACACTSILVKEQELSIFNSPAKCDPMSAPSHSHSHPQSQSISSPPRSKPGAKLLFLGSGSSTGCPKPICSLLFPPPSPSSSPSSSSSSFLENLQKDLITKCNVSRIASIGNPLYNKNYRNNPSLLISHKNDIDISSDSRTRTRTGDDEEEKETVEESSYKNVIIDVGKTFREGALRWMPHHSIYNIDAIVLTHEHADAVLGLDDLRGFQRRPYMRSSNHTNSNSDTNINKKNNKQDEWSSSASSSSKPQPQSLPIYLSSECLDKVTQQFDYLVPKNHEKKNIENQNTTNTSKKDIVRAVAALEFNIIHHYKPFNAGGLEMIPLPVMHGEDLICNGYAFTLKGKNDKVINVVYLSDISRMIPETEAFILNQLPPTDVLVVDSLLMNKEHPVHYSLKQALALVNRLRPKQTFIVGINCDDFPEHDEANEILKKNNPTVQLAHDGLVIEV